MSAHTPGPWKAMPGDGEWFVVFPDGEDASVLDEANARLIAAAPDLLEALGGVVQWFDAAASGPDTELAMLTDAISAARGAIARAKGDTP